MALIQLLFSALIGISAAQFPPEPEGVTTIKSKFNENVTISFKEPGICETTPGVKSYAGYVHLPSGFQDDADEGFSQNYPINTFFWFFEARKNPHNAPLTIWLNGGPGASSLLGLLEENGPCSVAEDSKSTILNPWSWNNEVNMLYLDQPVQAGFSYDVLTNATVYLDQEDGGLGIVPTNFDDEVPYTNLTTLVGTYSSQNVTQTANSTARAAHAVWHFAQTWFSEFPHYKPNDDGVSVWTESYGGHYGPGFVRVFEEQNEKIENGTITDPDAKYIHLDTLGIVNGLLDMAVQGEAYISFPYNNTYGIQVFNESVHNELLTNWTRPGGCKEQIITCQKKLETLDPIDGNKYFEILAENCGIEDWCDEASGRAYRQIEDRAWFDIGHPAQDPFPRPTIHGYLTQESVLGALGVPVNFTAFSRTVAESFMGTWDLYRGGFLEAVGWLLDRGIKVHMMYGDRDYACNWVGGEAASLAVPYSRAADFAAAGYAPFLSADGEEVGRTRQLGNFSFTRVYQAGHEVPSYQPAAALEIFRRATLGLDVATGLVPVTDELATVGPRDTWHIKNRPPALPRPRCYILKPDTCTKEVWARVKTGDVTIKDWYVVEDEEAQFLMDGL